jgi:hypothetical protein
MRTVPLLVAAVVLTTAVTWAQTPQTPSKGPGTAETAVLSVAKHLTAPYALYLYESLSRQILSNERLMERLDSPQSPMAQDSLWALDIIARSITIQDQDGEYVDIRRVPSFFADIAPRYLSLSHYWPDRQITAENKREQLAAWYSVYLMLLVANATQDEIAKTLQGGMFERSPEGLEPGGLSLVESLHRKGLLTDQEYALVRVKRSGPAGVETLAFPPYLEQWKAKISTAYGVK